MTTPNDPEQDKLIWYIFNIEWGNLNNTRDLLTNLRLMCRQKPRRITIIKKRSQMFTSSNSFVDLCNALDQRSSATISGRLALRCHYFLNTTFTLPLWITSSCECYQFEIPALLGFKSFWGLARFLWGPMAGIQLFRKLLGGSCGPSGSQANSWVCLGPRRPSVNSEP